MEGMRKFYLALGALGSLVLGLLLALAFGKFSDSTWTAWCTAVGGVAVAFMTANVITKGVTKPSLKGKRK